jgi:hypothetical protein
VVQGGNVGIGSVGGSVGTVYNGDVHRPLHSGSGNQFNGPVHSGKGDLYNEPVPPRRRSGDHRDD